MEKSATVKSSKALRKNNTGGEPQEKGVGHKRWIHLGRIGLCGDKPISIYF